MGTNGPVSMQKSPAQRPSRGRQGMGRKYFERHVSGQKHEMHLHCNDDAKSMGFGCALGLCSDGMSILYITFRGNALS
jgi:hypothetical protein